ncbi:MAG: preprotein translocase subunit YajC [Acidimicrobiia bacterium]|nr:preprotein translocase subunit YajC [Acidimicrobiia bacterium]
MIFAQTETTSGSPTFLILLVAFVAMYYFLIIRPQRRRQQEARALVDALQVGDEVRTYAGMHGTIITLTDETVTLRFQEGMAVFDRRAVASRKSDGDDAS